MSRTALVKRREEYLTGVSQDKLGEMYRHEQPGKSRDRLQAAVMRKQGLTIEKIAGMVGCGISTVHRWLSAMECEGLDHRHDSKSPGRPRLLSQEQEDGIEVYLDRTSGDSGFDRSNWNAGMVARRIVSAIMIRSLDRENCNLL